MPYKHEFKEWFAANYPLPHYPGYVSSAYVILKHEHDLLRKLMKIAWDAARSSE